MSTPAIGWPIEIAVCLCGRPCDGSTVTLEAGRHYRIRYLESGCALCREQAIRAHPDRVGQLVEWLNDLTPDRSITLL